MREAIRSLVRSVELFDVVLVLSTAAIAYGLWLINPALPFVAVGVIGLFIWSRATG